MKLEIISVNSELLLNVKKMKREVKSYLGLKILLKKLSTFMH